MSIEIAYNSWASSYDSNENKTRDLDKKATIETLEMYSFESVLELGSGTGKNTEYLVEKASKIICFDFSEKMLAKAKKRIASPKVQFVKIDLNKEWNLSDNSVDLITCSLTLEHIQNLDKIFNQAYHKLKQGGLFFICELHPIKQYLGSKAQFETEEGIKDLEVFTHHLSEYLEFAYKYQFKLLEIKEWFDDVDKDRNQLLKIPRLISFVFKK